VASFGERYELIRRIGAGGTGEVWLAHDELAGRPVAIKIMHKHLLPNSGDVARFERGMRFATTMDHPNIATVHAVGRCDGTAFLVMEYLGGHDLEKAVSGGDAERIAGIGRDICSGLAYAHGERVIHRDIKPANLFLCENAQVKITDFSVARAVAETARRASVLVGTFAYLPPERWRGEPPAVSGDVWAAGCVLYRLICGRPPRLLPDVADYVAAATRGEPVPDLRDITDAPGWLTGPVMAMLADDPARRPTAAECVRSLSSAQFPAPSPVLSVGNWRRPGHPGQDEPMAGPVGGAASEEPVLTPVARRPGAHTAAGRPRRPARAVAAIGGIVLLLAAGLIAALRFGVSPKGTDLAAGESTEHAASHATATLAVTASVPRSGSAASSPGHPAGSPATSGFASPTGVRSVSPSSSPRASSPATTAAGPTASATASSSPSEVSIPNVVGMSFPQAERLLQSDGFTVVGTHNPPGNSVVSTSPSGSAPAGSVITVVYGAGSGQNGQ
jgi:serine/threonine-protein kinase